MAIMVSSVLRRDEPPTIAGSSAGFIALIVCLVVIFLVSMSAIIYLLRHDRGSNNIKRYSNRRRRISEPASSARHPQSWVRLLIPFLYFRRAPATSPPETTSSQPAQDGHDWYQTGSGDSWDYTTPQLAEVQRPTAVPYSYSESTRTLSPPPSVEQPSSRSILPTANENLPRSNMAHYEIPALPSPSLHPDRDSPSIYSTLLSSRAFPSSPSPSPTSMSPGLAFVDLRERPPTPQRTDSPGGETIRRTFEGGSKFLEAL